MQKNSLKYFILALLAAAFVIGGPNIYAQKKLTFNEALKTAKKENKKVIIDVYTDWCGWCKKMDREAYSNSDIKEIIEDDFVLVKLDAEGSGTNNYNGKTYSDAELAAYFQVSGYPTTIFMNSKGKVIEFNYDKYKMNNLPGYYNTSDFKKVLEYIRDDEYKDTDLSTII